MALVVTWLIRKQNDGKGSLGLLEGLVVGGGRVPFDAQAYASVEVACKSGGVTKDLSHLKQAMTESSVYTATAAFEAFAAEAIATGDGDKEAGRKLMVTLLKKNLGVSVNTMTPATFRRAAENLLKFF